MKRKLLFALAAILVASVLTPFASAAPITLAPVDPTYVEAIPSYATQEDLETLEPFPASSYYYSQLTDGGKQIFDAVTSEENRHLLQTGKPITVGTPYSVTIPAQPTQEEYNALCDAFSREQQRLVALSAYLSDAAAAINRDLSDLFWTSGVQAATACLIDGVPTSGQFSFALGKTYTISLEITLPLGADWDGADATDRSLSEDIANLTETVRQLAGEAKESGTSRAEMLRYINDALCKYNDYNTTAAEGNYPFRYPWTALSALDQLTVEDDADGSLKPVCEGYARALKLICDELEIPCILVGGTGNGENHLWNYVQLENGYWYAMDVTWNDSTRSDRYFLCGKDVMDQKHTTSNHIMVSGQTVEFLYPVLSETTYQATAFSLAVSGDGIENNTLSGGGTVTITPNGVTDVQNLTVSCSDSSILINVHSDGSRTLTFPNKTATYVFDGIYRESGVDHTARITVSVIHAHQFGDPQPHNTAQHKYACDCGEVTYDHHAYGEWVIINDATEDEVGTRRKTCVCGAFVEEEIPKLEANEPDDSGNASENNDADQNGQNNQSNETNQTDGSTDTQSPKNGSASPNTMQKPSADASSGCSLSIAGTGGLLLCSLAATLALRKRKQ